MVTFGAPGLVGFMLVTGTLHTGLMGRQFLDAYREWWARLGGWLAVYACGWVLLFLLVAYMPAWLNAFVVQEDAKHHYRLTVSGVLLWVASTAYGVLFGRSSATGLPIPDAPLKKKKDTSLGGAGDSLYVHPGVARRVVCALGAGGGRALWRALHV